MIRKFSAVLWGVLVAGIAAPAFGAGDAARGAQLFRACVACHSVRPGEHLTGPSLANIVGRRAGTVEGFIRYSEPLREADLAWNEKTLDAWIANPNELIPGNLMTFDGMRDAQQRADLIAFLKSGGGNMMATPRLESLRDVNPEGRVTAIRYCKDSYFVTLGTGKTYPFWEFNVRFKTNGSPDGPAPGKPVILRAGMQGDRVSIVFADPNEISRVIERRCDKS